MSLGGFDWQCPVCKLALPRNQNQWRCDNGHSFDCAKEGYVNLLLAQQKNSKSPGDNKAMVLARKDFLGKDYYLPLANCMAMRIEEYWQTLSNDFQQFSIFDAGCGEGYYLKRITDALTVHNGTVHASGIDISKPAIQKAAKLIPTAEFAVASSFSLPVSGNSQDAVIQVFAPSSSEEILRVLKPSGIWITVNPAENHLFELKTMVYDEPTKHSTHLQQVNDFQELDSQNLSFTVTLDTPSDRENLLMMTPYYWSISEQKKQQVKDSLDTVTTDFDIKIWQKH